MARNTEVQDCIDPTASDLKWKVSFPHHSWSLKKQAVHRDSHPGQCDVYLMLWWTLTLEKHWSLRYCRWMWTWFSGYICFGASVFIMQLYMIHVYFNIKLNLYWIEEISVIIALSQVIRKTMLVTIRARCGLTRLESIFWKQIELFLPLRFLR